jgi:hypothetical protein
MRMFAARQRNFQLGLAALPVQCRRHQGITFAFHCTDQPVQLAPVQQQFAGARRVRHDMGGCTQQWRDMKTEQPGLVILDHDVAFSELYAAFTQTFYFPALQCQSGLQAIFNEIVMACLLVQRNGAG